MNRILVSLSLASLVVLPACGGNQQDQASEPNKGKPAPKTETAKAPDKADNKAEPAKADDKADAPVEGDKPAAEAHASYLSDALAALADGRPIERSETVAYGCSVKYASAGEPRTARVGEAAPTFSLPDLDGKQVSLADFAGKTVVLEWFNPDCPFVKYAHDGGPLATLAKQQGEAGIVWLAINSGAAGKQGHGAERNREAKQEWKLEHPILLDEDGSVGHSYGATNTPQMFVIDGEGKLVYAGALDNAPLGEVQG